MRSTSNATVVVVGGGVIGLSCAWRLAEAGRQVTLIERDQCGSGGSGVPVAALWPSAATKQGEGHRAHRESLWQFKSFVDELSHSTGGEIEFRRPGRIELFTSLDRRKAALRESEAACRDWPAFCDGPVQQVLTSDELSALEPAIEPGPFGGLVCHASAYVHSRQLIATLRHACIRSGVIVEEGREVHDLLIDSGRARGVLTGQAPVRADAVLVAAGAWTSQISTELHATGISPVKGQVLVVRPRHHSIGRLAKRGRTYLIPTASGEIVIGATAEPNEGFDRHTTLSARDELLASAAEIVPALADAQVVEQWAGLRPQPHERTARVGPVPGVAGLYVASGHYKIGVAMAPIAARQAVASIAGG